MVAYDLTSRNYLQSKLDLCILMLLSLQDGIIQALEEKQPNLHEVPCRPF